MNRSDSIASIGKALASVQAELGGLIATDSTNPMYESRYASLPQVIGSIRGVLNKYEIALIQAPIPGSVGAVVMETMLIHGPSGEYIGSYCEMPVETSDCHGVASAQTYARREGVMALLGLAKGPDDDGNAAYNAAVQTSALLPHGEHESSKQRESNGHCLASPEALLAEIEKSDVERLNSAERWVLSAQLDAHLSARFKGAIAQRRRIIQRQQPQHA
ncbi:ERF family protein (plasmid) [Vreelandella sp. SM1641]|uniref:ERF family protein n=1 Tax=Vreelandella sp. SM1641 TaxID=3126101 RepID=A0AAU7XU56_9GAMM|tara:strand:- start:8518 stop:9171 length:654 start_codon:yes stop_codon:yes gene_type:complete